MREESIVVASLLYSECDERGQIKACMLCDRTQPGIQLLSDLSHIRTVEVESAAMRCACGRPNSVRVLQISYSADPPNNKRLSTLVGILLKYSSTNENNGSRRDGAALISQHQVVPGQVRVGLIGGNGGARMRTHDTLASTPSFASR